MLFISVNRFFVIIDKRDFNKIQIIKDEKFYAFSENDKDDFNKIQKNDLIYFAKQSFSSWQFVLKVKKKLKNSKFVQDKWKNDLRSRNKKLILQFEEDLLNLEELPYVRKLDGYRPGIYKLCRGINTRSRYAKANWKRNIRSNQSREDVLK